MRKARIHLTLDVPLAADEAYPGIETDEERARLEHLMLLADPVEYFGIVIADDGPGWISNTSVRFVDEQFPGGST